MGKQAGIALMLLKTLIIMVHIDFDWDSLSVVGLRLDGCEVINYKDKLPLMLDSFSYELRNRLVVTVGQMFEQITCQPSTARPFHLFNSVQTMLV